MILHSNEDAALRGPWDDCRPSNATLPGPGQAVTITGPDGERLGATRVRSVTEQDLPRLAALMKAHPDPEQDVGFIEGDPAYLLSELRRTEGINCLLHWSAQVARSDSYSLRIDGTEYAVHTDDVLAGRAFFVETYLGP